MIEQAWDAATHDVQTLLDMPFERLGVDHACQGWTGSIMSLDGGFEGDFLRRAVIARQAIGAVSPREALYPRCGVDSEG